MSNPLISIIVPVYNVEDYLRRCLDSIINQTYKNLEIILVDDGSTDKSGDICEEYKAKDKRIIVIHQKNQGLSAARNAGLDIFKGEYVSFIDSDDYVDLRFIEELYSSLIKYNSNFSVCGVEVLYVDSNKTEYYNSLPNGICTTKHFFDPLFCFCWNKLFKGSLFLNIRFTVGRLFTEDAEVIYKILINHRETSGTGTILYHYCRRSGTLSHIEEKIHRFFYYDLDILSVRLAYFHNTLTIQDVNVFFNECRQILLCAKENKNTLYKTDAMHSYRIMVKVVFRKLSFKNKLIGKFPNLYYFYYRTLFRLLHRK